MENNEEILNNENQNIQAEEINNVSEPKEIDTFGIQNEEDLKQDTDDFENAVELPNEEEN